MIKNYLYKRNSGELVLKEWNTQREQWEYLLLHNKTLWLRAGNQIWQAKQCKFNAALIGRDIKLK